MTADVWTIVWRDLRTYRAQYEEPRRLVLGVLGSILFLIFLEFAIGIQDVVSGAHPVLLIWFWCWLPLGSAVTLSTDAIAGERERHTLESLLATRIPVRAILLGKALSITLQAWFSALMLALGGLVVLNLATIWNGEIFVYPWTVLVVGPLLSFLLTMLGTLVAIFFSMDAPTVRQANFRIVIVTSILPVILLVPLIFLLFFAALAFTFAVQYTDSGFDPAVITFSPAIVTAGVAIILGGLIVAIAIAYGATALRFTRERLLRTTSATDAKPSERPEPVTTGNAIPRYAFERPSTAPISMGDRALSAQELPVPNRWLAVLADARVVAWKELIEARGLVREWRGWLFVIAFVLVSMVIQLSAIGSWYWAQDADTSFLFWIAMAAAMPLFIAQRSADAIAGERERHTGEILFTTRLSHTGILLGKLGVTALLPWTLMLAIPGIGLLATNLIQSGNGPHFYPPDVLMAGLGLTLGVAFTFAAAGMLVSLGAPTVQHAARRISWFLMPILITPGLALRSSAWSTDIDEGVSVETSGVIGLAASGDLALYALAVVPLLALGSGTLVYFLYTGFRRGNTVFD